MTYEQECMADLIMWVIAAICFGIWQGSFFAGMFVFFMFLEWKAVKK